MLVALAQVEEVAARRELVIRLVDDDERAAGRFAADALDVGARHRLARRVVRRADEDDLHAGVERREYRAGIEREVAVSEQRHAHDAGVLNAGVEPVHVERRRAHEDLVAPGCAEAADQDVDRLAAAARHENLALLDAVVVGELFLAARSGAAADRR